MNNQTTIGTRTTSGKGTGKFASVQETANEMRDSVMDTAGETRERIMESARDVVDSVRERAGGYFESFNASPTSFIRANPMVSAVGGVFVGFLLGAAVCRRAVK